MSQALWIVPGAALGALARFALAEGLSGRLGDAFPWGTLAVNWIGCVLMGLLAGAIASRAPWAHEGMSLFLGVGFLGSFTTFSTFGLETVRLLQAGQVGLAATYVIASLVGGLAATWLGLRLA